MKYLIIIVMLLFSLAHSASGELDSGPTTKTIFLMHNKNQFNEIPVDSPMIQISNITDREEASVSNISIDRVTIKSFFQNSEKYMSIKQNPRLLENIFSFFKSFFEI